MMIDYHVEPLGVTLHVRHDFCHLREFSMERKKKRKKKEKRSFLLAKPTATFHNLLG
jgi:hypothetical protein